jgi:osmotically-inducible protein OsmY
MKPFISVLLCVMLLPLGGCLAVGGAIVAGASSIGLLNANTTTGIQAIDDGIIESRAQWDLARDFRLADYDIDVKVNDGVLVLHGDVSEQVEVDRAVYLMSKIEGVVHVYSELLPMGRDAEDMYEEPYYSY